VPTGPAKRTGSAAAIDVSVGQPQELLAIQGRLEGEVGLLEGLHRGEAGGAQPLEGHVLGPLGQLRLQQHPQELLDTPPVLVRLPSDLGEERGDRRQLEVLQVAAHHLLQQGMGAHGRTSKRAS
jgi:hypothetical protein